VELGCCSGKIFRVLWGMFFIAPPSSHQPTPDHAAVLPHARRACRPPVRRDPAPHHRVTPDLHPRCGAGGAMTPPFESRGTRHSGAPSGPKRMRRLKCLSGPAAGERYALDPDATEVVLPIAPGVVDRVAVYRVVRRRRARGAAFEVLVFAGNRMAEPAPPTSA
jgi:hypothetical protein